MEVDRERPRGDDVPIRDAESAEGSSQVVGPLSRESAEPTVSLSLSGYAGEETREAEYIWVHSSVCEVFSDFSKVSLLQDFVDSVDIVLDGVPSGAFALRRCWEFETVCLGRGKGERIFSTSILVYFQISTSAFHLMALPWKCCVF